MNIELKVWHPGLKAMYWLESLDLESYTVTVFEYDYVFSINDVEILHVIFDYPNIISESSVRLYSGDIVDVRWSNQAGEPLSQRVVIKDIHFYSLDEIEMIMHAEYLDYVGNKYENPELWEGTSDWFDNREHPTDLSEYGLDEERELEF